APSRSGEVWTVSVNGAARGGLRALRRCALV
ncbi:hypothetical protein A2U01_0082053, partial [Trifolium medium]|nr:hypothetical protein [Trifolium medium]